MATIENPRHNLISLLHFGLRALALPLLVVYFFSRAVGDRRYLGTLRERLGFLPSAIRRKGTDVVWLHAVSVGEVISSVRLVLELRRLQPDLSVYVSTATLAGRSVAKQKLEGVASGVFFAPLDYAFAVRRVLRRLRPAAVVILETEIWPLLYREARRAGCALVIVNGRISDRALPRYRALRFFFRHILSLPHRIFVQSDQDRDRYISVGAPAERVHVLGNLKYDTAYSETTVPPAIAAFLARLQPSLVWIAASTMPGADAGDIDEDRLIPEVAAAVARAHPKSLLVYAPRRPERFSFAAERMRANGIRFLLRTALTGDSPLDLPAVLLLDTIGELASLFPVADVVFIGGTLARRGGHNLLEPAVSSKPIVVGPHLENFPAIAKEFRSAGALVEIASPNDLAPAVVRLLSDAGERALYGRRAGAIAGSKRGSTAQAAQQVLIAMDEAVPTFPSRGISSLPGRLLSSLWRAGSALQRTRQTARARTLAHPVVSVGGLAMGGVGKTPFCAHLAERLAARGYHPAILTRGYHRRSLEESIILEAGAWAPATMTGDEAQIFVRFANAHVGIGADRYRTGRLIEDRLSLGVFLLDDGFQHYRLRRQLDIVLIDALDPFSGGNVFPHGRLREPLSQLRRAGCFVVTRAQVGRQYRGIRNLLREYNPTAPVFTARLEPCSFVDERTRQPAELPPGPVVAFCGLGNPGAFWRTLDRLRIEPVFQWTFDDHHSYLPVEIKRLAQQAQLRGARVLLTTEKDAMNLPERFLEIIDSLDLFWVKIDVRIEREPEFLELIESKLRE